MTQFVVNEVLLTQFDAAIKGAYQAKRRIPDDCCYSGMVQGEKVVYYTMGSATSSERDNDSFARTDIQGSTPGKVECLMKTYKTTSMVDPFTLAQLSFHPNNVIVENIIASLGRRMDQLKIEALNETGQQGTTIATNIGGNNSNLNLAKLLALKDYFDKENVPDSERYILCHSSQINRGLLQDDKIISGDYNEVKALYHGRIDEYLGFKFITIGNYEESGEVMGLPKDGNVRSCFAWHRRSLGHGANFNFPLKISELPEREHNLLFYMAFTANAKVIDKTGIVKINCTE